MALYAPGTAISDYIELSMRVLIVEDYTPLRIAVVKGLSDAGFSVDAAANGKSGLWQAKSVEYDSIILDEVSHVFDRLRRGDAARADTGVSYSYLSYE